MAKDDRSTKTTVYRSAKTGRFVTKTYATKNPNTTIRQTVKTGGTDHTGPRKK